MTNSEVKKESIVELMKLIFVDNSNLNKFLYKSIFKFLSKIDLERLTINKIFNISEIYHSLVSDTIFFINSNFEIQKRLEKTSIELDEIDIENSKSNLKIKSVCENFFKGALNSKYFIEFITDFLLTNLSTHDSEKLKIIRAFFETHFIEEKGEINFGILRKNSIERARYLNFIEKEQRSIVDLKEKVDEFLGIKKEQDEKVSKLKSEVDNLKESLNPIVQKLKESLEAREKLIKDEVLTTSKEYMAISNSIKTLSTQRTKLNLNIKNVNSKYELAKQNISNTLKNEEDYLKLLPEMIKTQENKIKNNKIELDNHEDEYIKIKEFIAEKLNDLKPDFDFDAFIKSLNKVVIEKEYCDALKKKRDEKEQRYAGLPKDELQKLKDEIFKSEEEVEKLIVGIVNQALKNDLNFQKISNVHFMKNNIKIIQKYLFDFLRKVVKNAEDYLITGFGNFIMREQFHFIFKIESKNLLTKVMNENSNAELFLSYYDGKIEEDLTGKYKKPEINDTKNKMLSPARVISQVQQYRNYVNFLTKKNLILKELVVKLKSLKDSLDKIKSKKDIEFKKMEKEYKEVFSEIKLNKQHKENFINTQKNIKELFENIEDIIAKTLHKKRTKIE